MDAGARVAITSQTLGGAEKAAEEIAAGGGEVFPLACDISSPEQVAAMAAMIDKRWSGVDILVNNAGIAEGHKFETHPDELWLRTINVNLTGTYYVTKAFVAAMSAQEWGRIINIASIAGKIGGKYIAAYSASKHGMLGLTRSLAVELAPHITVNAICPGFVDTPMTEASIENIVRRTGRTPGEARRILEGSNLQKRLIQPEEVADIAIFLAEDSARGITGQAINVDAGEVMV